MLYNYRTGTQPNQFWNPLTGQALGPGMAPSEQIRAWQPSITPYVNQRFQRGYGQSPQYDPGQVPTPTPGWNPPENSFGSGSPDFLAYMKSWFSQHPEENTVGRIQGANAPYQFPAMTYPTPGTNTIGGPVQGSASRWTPEYGGIPNVANPLVGEAGALQGNLANFGQISQLAGGINQLQQSQLLSNIEQAFPGFGARMAEGSEGIRYNLAGTISPDEERQLATAAAGMGLLSGQAGRTPLTNATNMAEYILSGARRRALGQEQLDRRIGVTPYVKPYDISGFMATGEQLTDATNRANINASAPEPLARSVEQQRMADLAMSRGLQAQDWLAERNYGRSQEDAAQNFARSLQTMVLGGQLSEYQAQRAWERAMAQLQSQKEPDQSRQFFYPNLFNYNRRPAFDFGEDIAYTAPEAQGPPRVGGPTVAGMLTPKQTREYYDAYYGKGLG